MKGVYKRQAHNLVLSPYNGCQTWKDQVRLEVEIFTIEVFAVHNFQEHHFYLVECLVIRP